MKNELSLSHALGPDRDQMGPKATIFRLPAVRAQTHCCLPLGESFPASVVVHEPLRSKASPVDRLKCAWLRFMPSLFSSIFNQPCSHQFSWPERRSEGGHYQVCTRCGDQYVYDWETLARAEKITTSGQSRTLAPRPSAQVPRTQRYTVRKPIFYRQVNHSQYHLAVFLNISASGLLLECHPSIPEVQA
jgi:hypothetical protein